MATNTHPTNTILNVNTVGCVYTDNWVQTAKQQGSVTQFYGCPIHDPAKHRIIGKAVNDSNGSNEVIVNIEAEPTDDDCNCV